MRISLLLLFHSVLVAASNNFFEVCPFNEESLGECLRSLCPIGSTCVNNQCCERYSAPSKHKSELSSLRKSKRKPDRLDELLRKDLDKLRRRLGGNCRVPGNEPIGVCLGRDVCPIGYTCENDACCNIEEGRRLRRQQVRLKKNRRGSWEELEEVEEVPIRSRPAPRRRGPVDYGTEEEEEDEEEEEERDPSPRRKTPSRRGIDYEEDIEDGDLIRNRSEEELTVDEEDLTSRERYGGDGGRTFSRRRGTRKREDEEEEGEEEEEEEEEQDEEVIPSEEGGKIDEEELAALKKALGLETRDRNHKKPSTKKECVSRLCPDGFACYENQCCPLTPEMSAIACSDSLDACSAELCDSEQWTAFMGRFCARTCKKCGEQKSRNRKQTPKQAQLLAEIFASMVPSTTTTQLPPPMGPPVGGWGGPTMSRPQTTNNWQSLPNEAGRFRGSGPSRSSLLPQPPAPHEASSSNVRGKMTGIRASQRAGLGGSNHGLRQGKVQGRGGMPSFAAAAQRRGGGGLSYPSTQHRPSSHRGEYYGSSPASRRRQK